MNTSGATGPGAPADRQRRRTELEIEEGQRRIARHGGSSIQTHGSAPASPVGEPIDTGIVAAMTAKQLQAEGIRRETPPEERPPAPAALPVASTLATGANPRDFLA